MPESEDTVTEVPEAPQPATEILQTDLDFLEIDHDLGLSYCFGSEEIYQEILLAFCEQAREYLPQLETQFSNCNWEQYAIIAHGIKGNALNIGASNFSKLSLQHEQAGKRKDSAFIMKECTKYISTLRSLIDKIEKMLA